MNFRFPAEAESLALASVSVTQTFSLADCKIRGQIRYNTNLTVFLHYSLSKHMGNILTFTTHTQNIASYFLSEISSTCSLIHSGQTPLPTRYRMTGSVLDHQRTPVECRTLSIGEKYVCFRVSRVKPSVLGCVGESDNKDRRKEVRSRHVMEHDHSYVYNYSSRILVTK